MSSRPLRKLDEPEAFEALRQKFVEAALDQLGRRDDLELNVAEVVVAAGSHNAAFYRVFGSKEGLLVAMAEEAVGRTIALLRTRVEAEETAEGAMSAWARVLLRLTVTQRGSASIQAFAFERHRFLRRMPESELMLVAPVKQVLLERLTTLGTDDASDVVDAAYELVMGQQATWIALRHHPTDEELDRRLRMVARLVRVDAEPAGARPMTAVVDD